MLNYKLPSKQVEKRGMIIELQEREKDYLVRRCGIDGNPEKEATRIKKTAVNTQALLNEFFTSIEDWLSRNKSKYDELRKSNINEINEKSILNKNNTLIILAISVIIGIAPLATSIILESASLWTLGVGTLITGASFTTASIIRLKTIKETEENLEFIRTFSSLNHELKIYKEETQITKEKITKESRPTLTASTRENTQELPYSFKKVLTKPETDKTI